MAEANFYEPSDDYPNFDITFDFDLNDAELIDYITEFERTDTTNNNSNSETSANNKDATKLPDAEVTQFIENNRNKNTTKKTRSDLNVFYRWAKTVNETRTLDEIPPTELDNVIAHFVLKVRKQDNSELEPDTLTSYIRSFDRFLREQGKPYSVLLDRQFAKARQALASKRKQLRRLGKGQRPNKAMGLTDNQIQKLWQEKQLGTCSSQTLLRTVWFNNTLYFGWRARDEHHRVKFGDFQVKQEDGPEKKTYVEWVTERGSKTRTGEHEFVPNRPFNPKMYATGGPRCPVYIFQEYTRRRPVDMNYPDAPFYLASIPRPATVTWFKKQPLGVNSLGGFMKEMSRAAGLDGRITNHSARRTMISALRKENVQPLNIIGLAGQRNLKSLDSYSEASEQQQKEMSNKISHHTQGHGASLAMNTSPVPERNPLKPLVASSSQMSAETNPMQGMFGGAVFNNCTLSFGGGGYAPVELPSTSSNGNGGMPKEPKRFKRILPLSDDEADEL